MAVFGGSRPPFIEKRGRGQCVQPYSGHMQQGYQQYNAEPGPASPRRWIPAIILIGVGVVFLLDNLNILAFDQVMKFWPVLLIALGLFLLVDRTFWQLGIRIFPRDDYFSASADGSQIRESAVFGGGKRRITSQDLTGGKIDAVFGGYSVDLREAAMKGDSAVIVVNAVFGGTEIRIPDTWSAVVQGQGVFGGFADNTRQPDPSRTPSPKRLIVKGSAVFGGVDIKN
jgi:hypothetical protein